MIPTHHDPTHRKTTRNDGGTAVHEDRPHRTKTIALLVALPLAFAALAGCVDEGDEDQREGNFDEMGVFQVYVGTKAPGSDNQSVDESAQSGLNGSQFDQVEDVELTFSKIYLGSGMTMNDTANTSDDRDTTNGTTSGDRTQEPGEDDEGAPLDDNPFEARDDDPQVGALVANAQTSDGMNGPAVILDEEDDVELEVEDPDDGEYVAEAVVPEGTWDALTLVVSDVAFEFAGDEYHVTLDNETVVVNGTFTVNAGQATQVLVWFDLVGALDESGALDEVRMLAQQEEESDDEFGAGEDRETQDREAQRQDGGQFEDADSDGEFDGSFSEGTQQGQNHLNATLRLEPHTVLIVTDAFNVLSLVNDFDEEEAVNIEDLSGDTMNDDMNDNMGDDMNEVDDGTGTGGTGDGTGTANGGNTTNENDDL